MASRTFSQIEPAVARGKLTEDLWSSVEWAAEEKYDGDRRIAQFVGDTITVVRFTGRRKSVKDGKFVEKTENLPHLNNQTISGLPPDVAKIMPSDAKLRALAGTVLDGEMVFEQHPPEKLATLGYASEGKSKFVTSIMGSLPDAALTKQIERGWLRYVVFDCLWYKGEDMRARGYAARRSAASQAVKEWGNPFVCISRAVGGRDKRAFYEEVVSRGGEGVILKNIDATYGDRQAWVKVKKEATADVVVMGYKPAKEMSKKKGEDHATMTKYAKAGLIGAIICGQWAPVEPGLKSKHLVEVATVSGMDDSLREMLSSKPGKTWIGKVIEIKHNGREPTGRFRHPRFSRPRPDKDPSSCVLPTEGEDES